MKYKKLLILLSASLCLSGCEFSLGDFFMGGNNNGGSSTVVDNSDTKNEDGSETNSGNESQNNNGEEGSGTNTNNDNENRYFTVRFVNYDDSELEVYANVKYGSIPTYNGTTPTRPKDDQYTYTFNGWSPSLTTVTSDVTYKAQYTTTTNTYTISWVDDDYNLIKTDTVPYGQVPSFVGTVPDKDPGETFDWVFDYWYPTPYAVTGNETYQAVYKQINVYTVTWKDGDTVLEVDQRVRENELPTYNGSYRYNDDDTYRYTFDKWEPEIAPVTGDITYQMVYKKEAYNRTLQLYACDGVFADGTDIYTINYRSDELSTLAEQFPENPTCEGYVFTGWWTLGPGAGWKVDVNDLENTYANRVSILYASYARPSNLKVTWLDFYGEEVASYTVNYGTEVNPEIIREYIYDNGKYYKFVSWSPKVTTITKDTTFVPQYEEVQASDCLKYIDYYGVYYVDGLQVPQIENVIIPETYNGKAVTGIKSFAFCDNEYIKSIVIPESVTLILNSAIYNLSNLEEVSLPASLENVGMSNFSNCPKLKCTVYKNGKYLGPAGNETMLFLSSVDDTVTEFEVSSECKIVMHGALRTCTSLQKLTLPFPGNSISSSYYHFDGFFGYIFGSQSFKYADVNDIEHNGVVQDYYNNYYYEYFIPQSLTTLVINGSMDSINCTSWSQVKLKNAAKGMYPLPIKTLIFPRSITTINDKWYELENVYYEGTQEEWEVMNPPKKSCFPDSTVHYYSEVPPTDSQSGSYWHYVDGEIVDWIAPLIVFESVEWDYLTPTVSFSITNDDVTFNNLTMSIYLDKECIQTINCDSSDKSVTFDAVDYFNRTYTIVGELTAHLTDGTSTHSSAKIDASTSAKTPTMTSYHAVRSGKDIVITVDIKDEDLTIIEDNYSRIQIVLYTKKSSGSESGNTIGVVYMQPGTRTYTYTIKDITLASNQYLQMSTSFKTHSYPYTQFEKNYTLTIE